MQTKVCTKCKIEKPWSEFSLRKSRNNRPYSNCKKCKIIDVLNRRNSEKHLEVCKNYYHRHREKILANQDRKNKVNIYKENWRKNNLWLDAKRACERRRIIKQAKPSWANNIAIESIYKEAQIKREESGLNFHVDHIIPLKSKLVCGLHNEFNLRVIPAKENLTKHNVYWPNKP